MAIRLGRLAMVMSMRIKVNVADLPKPPYTMPNYRYPTPVQYPKDAVIVKVGTKPKPTEPTKDWLGRNRKDLWTDEMRKKAWSMIVEGRSVAEVAEAVGRGEKATYQELCSIRREKGSDIAIKPRKIVYTPEVDAVIIRMHNSNQSYMEIGKATGRTKWAIKARVNYLRKHGLIAKDNRKDR